MWTGFAITAIACALGTYAWLRRYYLLYAINGACMMVAIVCTLIAMRIRNRALGYKCSLPPDRSPT